MEKCTNCGSDLSVQRISACCNHPMRPNLGEVDFPVDPIPALNARIEQIERELDAERENNVGEFESRSEAERKVRTLKAQVMGLERELADFKASQHYRYIGVDGKLVLARELEDRAIKAERELADLKSAIFGGDNYWKELSNGNFVEMAQILHSALKGGLVRAEKAEADLAAEKALADRLWDFFNAFGPARHELRAAYRKARGL